VAGTLQDGRRHAFRGHASGKRNLAKIDPVQFSREVRQEVAKVTWPSRRETLVTTGLVLALSALAAVFFLVVDQIIQLAMSFIFGF